MNIYRNQSNPFFYCTPLCHEACAGWEAPPSHAPSLAAGCQQAQHLFHRDPWGKYMLGRQSHEQPTI